MPGSAASKAGARHSGLRPRQTQGCPLLDQLHDGIYTSSRSTRDRCSEMQATHCHPRHLWLKQPIQASQSRGSSLVKGSREKEAIHSTNIPCAPAVRRYCTSYGGWNAEKQARATSQWSCVTQGRQTMTSADLPEAPKRGQLAPPSP